jgi:hypothetical protein
MGASGAPAPTRLRQRQQARYTPHFCRKDRAFWQEASDRISELGKALLRTLTDQRAIAATGPSHPDSINRCDPPQRRRISPPEPKMLK